MTVRPLFHAVTRAELTSYAVRLPQGILLYGKPGAGLDTAASWLANEAGVVATIILPEYEEKVNLDRGSITIDIIRRLYEQTRTKGTKRQCIIISHADTMTIGAQHAFLKLLEEPGETITFILVCHQLTSLLPTILSRVQQIKIRPIDRHQSEALLTSLEVSDPTTRTQLLFIAEGRPGLLTQLASDPRQFEAEATKLRQAKAMIQGTQYERLMVCQQLKDDRAMALAVVSYMLQLLKREVVQKKGLDEVTGQLMEQLERATVRLGANANVRLALADALLS